MGHQYFIFIITKSITKVEIIYYNILSFCFVDYHLIVGAIDHGPDVLPERDRAQEDGANAGRHVRDRCRLGLAGGQRCLLLHQPPPREPSPRENRE